MKLFKANKDVKVIHPSERPSVEIVAHHSASKEVVKEAQEANQKLKKLLEDNHFTLKIYLAAGGKPHSGKV